MQLKLSMKYVIIACMRNITIINGAGISVNAGISAFRGTTGAWTTEPDVRNAFNLNVFMTKPKARTLLWDWLAYSPAWNAEPTIAHQEIKRLNDNKALMCVFTQNFDGLEAKTGLEPDRIHYLHGNMLTSSCQRCGRKYDTRALCDNLVNEPEPHCHAWNERKWNKRTQSYGKECGGVIKPDIVFFGENLDKHVINTFNECLTWTDELWVIGSSLQVFPVADMPKQALLLNKTVRIVNMSATPYDRNPLVDCVHEDIDAALPGMVDRALTD